ncbi:MAG: SMI1/KNR4 family protein [Planctomycetes bacterium]|jgi:hypothetical protein|nr:SMI1/KNR4 family protein [Planctomycetota bacterium]
MPKPNFWIQPCDAFDERSRGRTETELAAHEASIGFRLPRAYRELLRLQNGGEIRWSELPGSDLSVSHFSEIGRPGHLVNFRDYLLATASDEELADCARQHAPFHPERLVLFSGLDGHSCACFDYGYRQAEPRTEPEVVFLGDDAGDLLGHGEIGPRLPSFAALLEALQPGGDFAERTFLGLVSPEPYGKLVATMQQALGTRFEARTDDRNGHFDFDVWHVGAVPLELDDDTLRQQAEQTGTTFAELRAWAEQEGRTRHQFALCSPNRRRSGTFLFQAAPELVLVLEIADAWFDHGRPMAQLIERLRAMPAVTELVRLNRW